MTQQETIILAKQGDVQAIAYLINQSLSSQSIKARVALSNGLLQVILEADTLPNQDLLAPMICKGVSNLNIELVSNLRVYGRKTGEKKPSWSRDFKIAEIPETTQPDVFQEPGEAENPGKDRSRKAPNLFMVMIYSLLAWVGIMTFLSIVNNPSSFTTSAVSSQESVVTNNHPDDPPDDDQQQPSEIYSSGTILDKLEPKCQESRSSLTKMTMETQTVLASRGYNATSDEILEGVYTSVSPYTEPQVCASVFYLIATLVGK